MQTLQTFIDAHYRQMEATLAGIKEGAQSFREEAEQCIPVIRQALHALKEKVLFEPMTKEAEIYLFRQGKPLFYSQLIYYCKALQIELAKPTAGHKAMTRYLEAHQAKLVYFFKKYHFFHLYCRSGSTSLDKQFFVRGGLDLLPGISAYGVDTDPSFTTGYDFLLAKIKANDRIQQYLDEEQSKLHRHSPTIEERTKTKIAWTGSKASLIELLYALQSTGVLNHGRVALNDIAQFIEAMFSVKLGNYYRVFQEIRIRKKSRTQFLDEMKERLIQKMDYTDENPHIL